MRNITKGILALSLALALVALGTTAASAADVTDWNGSSTVSDTFDVTNDTEELRVTVENVTNDQADVTVIGIDSDSAESQVATGTVTTDAPNGTYTDTYTYTGVDPTAYEKYRVEVTGDGADAVSIQQVGVLDGGAGFLSGSGGMFGYGLGQDFWVLFGLGTVATILGLLYRADTNGYRSNSRY